MNGIRRKCSCLSSILLIVLLPAFTASGVAAVDCSRSAGGSVENILQSNFTVFTIGGHVGEQDLLNIDALIAAGKKFNHISGWWNETVNNPLDIYYNESYRNMAKAAINFSRGLPINGIVNPDTATIEADRIWGVTLGDEEPSWLRFSTISSSISPDILKYNDTYLAETGYVMKPLAQCNNTEHRVFVEWMNERANWVYSYMYDYVRRLVPHAVIIQYLLMSPTWGISEDIGTAYEVNGDYFAADCYYA
ncbi:MAG: hypothetical protein ACFFF4_15650, partial [Candidatus Thorarchaeota archaeon]